MNSRDRAQLRTRLRQVNIEYSSLVRERPQEGRFRITELTIERRAIMSLLFGGEWAEQPVTAVRQPRSVVATLHPVE
jgi:hypothetical protein